MKKLLAAVGGLGCGAVAVQGCALAPAAVECGGQAASGALAARLALPGGLRPGLVVPLAALPLSFGWDAIKLLTGLVLLLAVGFAYWISPAYERLYRKLFGHVDEY